MIEINMLPGVAAKKARRAAPVPSADEGRGAGALDGLRERLRDKYLLAAVACVALSIVGVGGLYTSQQAEAASLAERETTAVADSSRYATLLAERRRMTAERDSLQRSLAVIATIDSTRYIWPHVLDEVSRALPIYTWLTAVQQTSSAPTPDGVVKAQGTTRTAPPPPVRKPGADSTARGALRFRVVGHTVDIQALTRFMRDLEASPFVRNVQLGSSQTVLVENKDVTEFTLDAEYEAPDRALLRTAPLTVVVR
jgi:Tfp pilus assembly protein PilN